MNNCQTYITDLLSVIAKLIDSNSISGSDAVKMIRNIISLESALDNINKDVTHVPPFIPSITCEPNQDRGILDQIIFKDFNGSRSNLPDWELPDNSSSISVRPVEQPVVYTVTSTKEHEQHT